MDGERPTGFWQCNGYAVPQGLCENLTKRSQADGRPSRVVGQFVSYRIKLLANKQKDGDSPIQNIIMGQKEKCKKRITNIDLDNRRAVEVGHLRRGQRPFKVVRPKMSGDCSEVLREGVDDFTRRAEEFDTLTLMRNFGDRPTEELKEVSGKSCTIITEIRVRQLEPKKKNQVRAVG